MGIAKFRPGFCLPPASMPLAHIIGLGQSGIAAARLLHRQGWQVCISDSSTGATLRDRQQQLQAEGMAVLLGYRFDLTTLAAQGQSRPDRLVISPGVPWQLPSLVEARNQGIEMFGEMELAWRSLHPYPWVGITGTNGKTTTTALTAAIFQAAGLAAPACGNIGYSACDLALSGQPLDWVIAEISSYQLESAPAIAPRIGVWTTFTPDHLNRHGNLECYREVKALLLQQSAQQILNADDPYLRQMLCDRWPHAWWTSTSGPAHLPGGLERGVYLEANTVMVQGQPLLEAHTLRMPGDHNRQNLLMAVTVAHLAGIHPSAIAQAIANFPGVPHRLEHLLTWRGIDFINDSKATNYDAAQTGLAAVKGPVILIAGGDPKIGDDQSWIETIHAKAAAVLLIGAAAPSFAQRLEQTHYTQHEIVETLDRAVLRAATLAEKHQAAVVLLSPACASYDQYANFEQRGDHFRQLCQQLL